jgi:acyl carrier protein
MSDTSTKIRDYIVHNFLFDDESSMLPDDASLLKQGIIDSTGVLDLLLFVEEAFGIDVPDEDVTPDNFDSVASLARYIECKKNVPV